MLLACFALHSYCQNICIADFIRLRGNEKETIECTLNAFNIYLSDENELNNGRIQFTFLNEAEKATAFHWIDFLYLKEAQWNNRLSFQTQEMELVKKYLAEMKTLGFKFINKKIVDRRVYDVYTDGKNTIELINSQIKNDLLSEPNYIFAFYNADEYKYVFAEENKLCSLAVHSKDNLLGN